jgi:glycosyltransferase involved in cell wall biosynthesis
MSSERPAQLFVAGYYADGDGYPNGRVTQSLLADRLGLRVRDLGTPMGDRPLWKMAGDGTVHKLASLLRILGHNVASALRVLWHARRRHDVVYVRYPAIPFMLLMSVLPRRLRPPCYVDAFISIWDSMFVDRRRGGASRAARVVHALERRALAAAEKVLVDTVANAAYMAKQFGLAPGRVVALPLGVDESAWTRPASGERGDAGFTITFVGTFIPLHGIAVITDALARFDAGDGIRFRFVGDGQEAPLLADLIARRPDLAIDWQREWQTSRQLAAIVAQSDICLGVFGGGGKAARVLPYKLYLYLCLGAATISQAALSTPSGEAPPALLLDAPNGAALAAAILRLKQDGALRARLGTDGRAYFEQHLGNAALADAWRRLLPPQFIDELNLARSRSG